MLHHHKTFPWTNYLFLLIWQCLQVVPIKSILLETSVDRNISKNLYRNITAYSCIGESYRYVNLIMNWKTEIGIIIYSPNWASKTLTRVIKIHMYVDESPIFLNKYFGTEELQFLIKLCTWKFVDITI